MIPTLQTERLRLAPPAARHLDDYTAFYASDRSAHLGGPKSPEASWRAFAALIGHWEIRGFGRWIIEEKATGAYWGHVGLLQDFGAPEPELTWSVVADAEGRGVAREAAEAARRYAYETLGWATLISMVLPDNARSIALAERMGAVFEREHDLPGVGPLNVYRHPSPDALTAGAAA